MKEAAVLNLRSSVYQNERIECIENHFYISELSKIDLVKDPFRIDMYICCVCSSGASKGRINLIPYTLERLDMSINIPGQLLEQEWMSDDFRGTCIFMSNTFVGSLGLPYNFQTYMAVQENPVISLNEGQFNAMQSYCTMVYRLFEADHPNKSEIIKHLTCAFFYGIGYYFHQVAENKALSNEEVLMQDFLKVVQKSYKKERKVIYYADKLHLTAGYLSTIIKKRSGRTAAEWIDEYVILEAKALLKSTSMTIQQVSDELNFPSQSFFGKYFKRKMGVSPKEYKKCI